MSERRTRQTRRDERGSMAVEIVILAPVMIAFLLLIVAAGRLVSVKGDVEAASRDAARAASLERSADAATVSARSIVSASLDQDTIACQPASLSGNFVASGVVTVTLTCRVSYDGLGLIGLPGSAQVQASSSAPIDRYRRTG